MSGIRGKKANRVKRGDVVLDNNGEWQTVTSIKRGMASEVCLVYANGSEEWMHWSEPCDVKPDA